MSRTPLDPVVRHIRRLANEGSVPELTDAQLLERFRSERDENAFARLVQRHGGLVLGVCRRVLHHEQEAEDAFQATFLLLASGAGSIRKQASVGSWLYGVAFRIARKARARSNRRREREAHFVQRPQPQPAAEASLRELQRILDEEVQRLPEKYRVPFVLCCLEGMSKAEAAKATGWKAGTMSGRLAQARELLRRRLAWRGVTLSAALCMVALSETRANAALSTTLVSGTARAAIAFVTGKTPAVISAEALELVRHLARAALAVKMKAALAVFVALALLVAGVGGVFLHHLAPTPARVDQKAEEREAKPPPQAPVDQFGDPLPPGALARIGTVRFRHGEPVLSVAFTHDRKILASAGHDSSIRIWDAESGKELRRFDMHSRPFVNGVLNVAISPNDTFVAGRGYNEVYLWDREKSENLRTFRIHAASTLNCAPLVFSPDNRMLATAGNDRAICLWDVASGNQQARMEGHADLITSLAFTSDGQRLVSGSLDRTARLWSLATRKEVRQFVGHSDQVWSVAISPDATMLASTGMNEPRLWDLASGKEIRRLPARVFGTAAFTPDGKLLTGGHLWDVQTGKEARQFTDYVSFFSLSADGKTLASWSGSTFRLFDVATGKPSRAFPGHRDDPVCITFAPDGKTLFTGSREPRAVQVWEADTGKARGQWAGTPIKAGLGSLLGGSDHPTQDGPTAFAVSPDGKTLAVAHGLTSATLYLWDLAAGREIRGFATPHRMIAALAFSPDGKSLVSADYLQGVICRDPNSGKQRRILTGPSGQIKALWVSSDSKSVAVAGGTFTNADYDCGVWDLATGRELQRWKKSKGPVSSLSFSPDGKILAVGGFNQTIIYLWEVATGRDIATIKNDPWLQALAFAPDGRTLALAHSSNEVSIWELAGHQERCRFKGHQGMIRCLAFSADGNRLATGSRDTTALVWELTGRRPGHEEAVGAQALADAWVKLGEQDPKKAFSAMTTFFQAGKQAVTFLAGQVPPAAPSTSGQAERIAKLVAGLDSPRFTDRNQAMQELEKLGDLAEPALRKALAAKPSLEVSQRLETLLAKLDPAGSPSRLRILRALEILERLGTSEAREHLARLATGAPDALLTREARAAAERLARLPVRLR
jgi:RNA polymerase sigma factor (sigma-70 family)